VYCTNCGKKMNDNDMYCTNCGAKRNFKNESSNNDNNYPLFLAISLLFPIVGIVFYVLYRKKSKKAKNYLIAALIRIALQIVVIVLAIFLDYYVYYKTIDNFDRIDNYIEENKDDDENNFSDMYELVEFDKNLQQYVKLAKEKYQSDGSANACYDIDNLSQSLKYDGSIEISNMDEELVVMIWLTDGDYYVSAMNYDDYDINKIKNGNEIEKSCKIGTPSNSL
jgi:predicted  nucleic acid-binding Zn-ribbon protein